MSDAAVEAHDAAVYVCPKCGVFFGDEDHRDFHIECCGGGA